MAATKRVGRVDVSITCDAEGGVVGLARYVSGGLLADLAEPDSGVAGSELVGGVDLGVTVDAEEG